MINTYEGLFVPFITIFIDGMPVPQEFTNRLISAEIEYDDEKSDMLTLVFDNRDYYVSDSPYVTREKKVSLIWGYINDCDNDKNFIIKDLSGVETYTVVAYKGGEIRNKSKGSTKSTVNPYGGSAIIRSNKTAAIGASSSGKNPRQQPVPKEIWKKNQILTVIYNDTDPGNIVINFSPSIKTESIPSTTAVESLDIDSKEFVTNIIKNVSQKLGVPEDIQNHLEKAGVWIIDGITGVEKFIKKEAEELIEKIIPLTPNSSANNDITGGVQGGNEVKTEASLDIIGVTKIRPKNNILIKNANKLFSGKWYIKTVRFKFDNNGFVCNLSLLRPSIFSDNASSLKIRNINNNSEVKDKLGDKVENYIIVDGYTGEEFENYGGD